ncbi:MAG: HEAT repeat domain-containing protein [Pseudomonadota bacterium]
MKIFRIFLALLGCVLVGILFWWKAIEGPKAIDIVEKSSQVQEESKQTIQKISMSVSNGAGLQGREISTQLTAEGMFHIGLKGLSSITFKKVRGTIEGQGNITPAWAQFEEGVLVIDRMNSLSTLAWKGKTLGAVEWNILRLLANAIPPVQRFHSESKVSYKLDDLYGSGDWVWVATKAQDDSVKWTSSFVPEKNQGDNFWKRDSLWTILKTKDSFHIVAHDVLGISVKDGKSLVIDSRGDIQLGQPEKSTMDLSVYKDLAFLPLRPIADQTSTTAASNQKSKEQLIKQLRDNSREGYFDFKNSLDLGEWSEEDLMKLAKELDRKSQGYRDFLAVLAQTKASLGKEMLLGLVKQKWDHSPDLVKMIPLLGQGSSYNQDVIDWLGYASENHPVDEVKTTSRLAMGTVANSLRESHPEIAQKILEDSFDKLHQFTDKNEISAVTDMLASIGNSGGDGIESKLDAWYGHSSADVRAAAYFALRHELNQQKAVQRLLIGMDDSSRVVRGRTVEALESMKLNQEQIKNLANKAREEKDPQVKSALNDILSQNRSKI